MCKNGSVTGTMTRGESKKRTLKIRMIFAKEEIDFSDAFGIQNSRKFFEN
jgi:hypothetical protein